MSTGGQTARGRDIPATRRVTIHDAAQMPKDCCATPGGTLFSTTPGGTRIIYDRKFLLQCRTSPLARTPPSLPDIPGVTRPHKPQSSSQTDTDNPEKNTNINGNQSLQTEEGTGEEPLFDMDI